VAIILDPRIEFGTTDKRNWCRVVDLENNFIHWVDEPLAMAWLKRAETLLDPKVVALKTFELTTPYDTVIAEFRRGRIVSDIGRQSEYVREVFEALANVYNALNLPVTADPKYVELYRRYLSGTPRGYDAEWKMDEESVPRPLLPGTHAQLVDKHSEWQGRVKTYENAGFFERAWDEYYRRITRDTLRPTVVVPRAMIAVADMNADNRGKLCGAAFKCVNVPYVCSERYLSGAWRAPWEEKADCNPEAAIWPGHESVDLYARSAVGQAIGRIDNWEIGGWDHAGFAGINWNAVQPLRLVPPLKWSLEFASNVLASLKARVQPGDHPLLGVVRAARADTTRRNLEMLRANASNPSELFGLMGSAESRAFLQSMTPSTEMTAAVQAGYAASAMAGAANVYAGLAIGAVTLTADMMTRFIPNKDNVTVKRDEFGRFKPFIEHAWLAGGVMCSQFPEFVIPAPPLDTTEDYLRKAPEKFFGEVKWVPQPANWGSIDGSPTAGRTWVAPPPACAGDDCRPGSERTSRWNGLAVNLPTWNVREMVRRPGSVDGVRLEPSRSRGLFTGEDPVFDLSTTGGKLALGASLAAAAAALGGAAYVAVRAARPRGRKK
jgi:hypothetical protein